MPSTHQFNITLTGAVAAMIAEKIDSGAYASATDVVHDGLHALLEREHAVEDSPEHNAALEHWLRTEVVAGIKEDLADPSKRVPAEDILEHIKARRRQESGA